MTVVRFEGTFVRSEGFTIVVRLTCARLTTTAKEEPARPVVLCAVSDTLALVGVFREEPGSRPPAVSVFKVIAASECWTLRLFDAVAERAAVGSEGERVSDAGRLTGGLGEVPGSLGAPSVLTGLVVVVVGSKLLRPDA